MTLSQGNLLYNRYRVVEILGRGGMGAVYRAVDESLGVDVAVKENLFTNEDCARQFRMEAIILAGIRHPNLPRVTDHFVIDEMGQYLIMDYIDGEDLRQHIERDGPLSEDDAVRIGTATCSALTYLHSHKPPIFHRDIKLGNIKISTDRQVYLVDFGLAKMGWEHEETLVGARATTPGYSPPEQYGSARTDARTDIYSLGATLYAALTGIIPEDSLIRAVESINLTPLREHRPEISPRLAAVIEKALEVNSSNRYQSAEAFKQALLGQTELRLETEKAFSEQLSPIQKPDDGAQKRSFSLWRIVGYFLILLLIVAGAIRLNPLNQQLFRSGSLASPALSFSQTPLPTSSPGVISSNTPLPAPTSAPKTTLTIRSTPAQSIISTSAPIATVVLSKTATKPVTPTVSAITSSPIPETTAPTASTFITSLPQATPLGGGPGEIAFASILDNSAQIFLLDVAGTALRPLTNDPNGACSFDWSPDGKLIVFVSPCLEKATQYPNSGLYLLNVETGTTEPLPFAAAGDFEPAWSPDGQKIAFTSLRDGSMQIYAFDLGDKSLTRLTSPGENTQSRYPTWSPDSSQIAFTTLRLGLLQIWSMSADGSNKQQLLRTGGSFSEYLPSWSPDGTSLFFSRTNSNLSAPSSLASFDFQTNKISLLPIPQPVVDVDFSPDGQWVTYETTDTKNPDIYIFPLLIGSAQRLTSSPQNDFDPVWRPGK